MMKRAFVLSRSWALGMALITWFSELIGEMKKKRVSYNSKFAILGQYEMIKQGTLECFSKNY